MAASGQSRQLGNDVCIVGTGMIGLVAIKNLREQGLNPTAFTKDEYVGGLWHMDSDKDKTTALDQTTCNTSKQAVSFTDFPMPDEAALHPSSRELSDYLASYAKHFDLLPHIRLSEAVIELRRDDEDAMWLVTTRNTHTHKTETHRFSRVLLATGQLNTPNEVRIKGEEQFQGELIHSRQFKDPAAYKDKNVLVVGMGATGADTLVFLRDAGAGKLYSSHRGNYWVLPRVVDGKALDHGLSRRTGYIIRYIASCSTALCAWLMGKGLAAAQGKAFPFLKGHPAFSPKREAPWVLNRVPFFSDKLAEYLRDGKIEDVCPVEKVTGPRRVRLADGREVDDLDAIIVATGYGQDLSLVQGKGDPHDPAHAPDGYRKIMAAPGNAAGKKFPRLYRGFISEQYPESLAILGHFVMMKSPFPTNDLATMALASIWSGRRPAPTAGEMRRDIDRQYDFVVSVLQSAPMPHWGFRIDSRETYDWMNRTAGTGVMERLGGWGWTGWKFWWNENKLYKLLMDGVDVPSVYRLFDTGGGRKPWAGARRHIETVNKEVEELGRKWEREQKAKAKQI